MQRAYREMDGTPRIPRAGDLLLDRDALLTMMASQFRSKLKIE
jgi:hypothetical protein